MARRSIAAPAFRPWQRFPDVGTRWPVFNRASDQAEGLAAWWPANPMSAQAVRDHLDRWGFAAMSNAWPSVSFRTELGRTLYFDGATSEGLDTGDIELSKPFSLASWCIPEFTNGSGAQAYAKLVMKRTTANADPWVLYALGADNSSPGKFEFAVSTGIAGSQINVQSTTTLSSGTLYYVVGVYDGTNVNIYVDGTYEAQSATSLVVGTSSVNTTIGRYPGTTANNNWKGWIGDVRIYNRALSAAEVAALYDPATRWELYAPVAPMVWSVTAAAAYPLPEAWAQYRRRRV